MINKNNIEQIFTLWLKEQNCYDQYVNNLRDQYYSTIKMLILEHYDYNNLIAQSFTWRNTPEGYNYWHQKHKEWKYLSKKNFLKKLLFTINIF